MNMPTWIVDVKQDPNNPDEVYIELPVEVITEMGLQDGDELEVTETLETGEIVLVKK